MSDANVTRNARPGPRAPKVEVMQSYLSRARGLGAAGSGALHHWMVERLTAVALVPLTIWFIYVVLHLVGAPQAAVHRFVGSPINTVLLLALVVMTFQHLQLGLKVVLEDYMNSETWRMAAILCVKAASVICGLLCAVSILRMAFTA